MEDDVRVEAHVVVTGRVQGVWFRGSTQNTARAEGVTGWVRNLPDRSVEALLQGPPEAVARVVNWMRLGPPGSRVTDIRVEMRPEGKRHAGFDVLY